MCDMWSIGVILYILLSGYPPFNGNSNKSIIKAIKEQEVLFEDKIWKTRTDESIDLIKKLLERDVDQRYTAAQALQHPWIKATHEKKKEKFDADLMQSSFD